MYDQEAQRSNALVNCANLRIPWLVVVAPGVLRGRFLQCLNCLHINSIINYPGYVLFFSLQNREYLH